MTKVIVKERGQGKTIESIIESFKTGKTILVPYQVNKRYIKDTAKEFGYSIPNPICIQDLKENIFGTEILRKGLILDESTKTLEILLGSKIHMITLSEED